VRNAVIDPKVTDRIGDRVGTATAQSSPPAPRKTPGPAGSCWPSTSRRPVAFDLEF